MADSSFFLEQQIVPETPPIMERKPKEDDDVSKKDMIETIEIINLQLKENKKAVEAYSGQEMPGDSCILAICELSKALIEIKQLYKEILLWDYGFYYKG